MSYTKSVAIEQVYLRVNAGGTSTETNVKREDIEPYLIAAIGWAWGVALTERQQQAIRNKRYGVQDETSYNDLRVTKYLTPTLDKRKGEYYVNVSIPTIAGLQYFEVNYVQGTKPIRRIDKRSELSGLEDTIGDTTIVYYLKNPNERLYFINLVNYGDCEIEVTSNIDYSAIGDDDIIPIPSEKEVLFIDKIVEFFLGQKIGEDNAVDENDTPTEK